MLAGSGWGTQKKTRPQNRETPPVKKTPAITLMKGEAATGNGFNLIQ